MSPLRSLTRNVAPSRMLIVSLGKADLRRLVNETSFAGKVAARAFALRVTRPCEPRLYARGDHRRQRAGLPGHGHVSGRPGREARAAALDRQGRPREHQPARLRRPHRDAHRRADPLRRRRRGRRGAAARRSRRPGAESLGSLDLDGERILLKTRNSELWERDTFADEFLSFTGDGAAHLVARGVRLIGIDYLSVGGEEAHHALLEAGVVAVEGLDLRGVEPGEYQLVCAPLKLVGSDGAPARVLLLR